MTVLMTDAPRSAYRPDHPVGTLVVDVDSALCAIDGFEWLAARRGDIVARRVADLTQRAAQGLVPLSVAYAARLNEIRPRRDELDLLARAYVDALAPGAARSIARIRTNGAQIVLVSHGMRHALLRLALHLGLGPDELHAVHVSFDGIGAYTGFDASSPLTMSDGKALLVTSLDLDGPVVGVGGPRASTAMLDAVDRYIPFTGFTTGLHHASHTDDSASTFADIERFVLA